MRNYYDVQFHYRRHDGPRANTLCHAAQYASPAHQPSKVAFSAISLAAGQLHSRLHGPSRMPLIAPCFAVEFDNFYFACRSHFDSFDARLPPAFIIAGAIFRPASEADTLFIIRFSNSRARSLQSFCAFSPHLMLRSPFTCTPITTTDEAACRCRQLLHFSTLDDAP